MMMRDPLKNLYIIIMLLVLVVVVGVVVVVVLQLLLVAVVRCFGSVSRLFVVAGGFLCCCRLLSGVQYFVVIGALQDYDLINNCKEPMRIARFDLKEYNTQFNQSKPSTLKQCIPCGNHKCLFNICFSGPNYYFYQSLLFEVLLKPQSKIKLI